MLVSGEKMSMYMSEVRPADRPARLENQGEMSVCQNRPPAAQAG